MRSGSSARSKSSSSPAGRCPSCRARAKRATRSAPRSRSRSCRRTAPRCTRGSRALRRDARRGPRRASSPRCARATRSRPTCRRCAASAIGRRGNFSTAGSTRPRCARAASPRRASSRNASSRGCARRRRRRSIRRIPTSTTRSLRSSSANGRRRRPDSRVRCCAIISLSTSCSPRPKRRAARHARAHALRQALGQPCRPHRGGRHGAALHRSPPRARGDEPAGVRRAEARRAQALARRLDRRDRRSQHADEGLGTRASPIRSRARRSRRSTPT